MIRISAETDERERCTICRERAELRYAIEATNVVYFACRKHRHVVFGELLKDEGGSSVQRFKDSQVPLVKGGQGHDDEEAGFCGVAGTACLVAIFIIVGIAILAGM